MNARLAVILPTFPILTKWKKDPEVESTDVCVSRGCQIITSTYLASQRPVSLLPGHLSSV
jgi:hypothetical protein